MTRRKITRADEAMTRLAIEQSLGISPVVLRWDEGTGSLASIRPGGDPLRPACANDLASAGIHPGADGWEIDEATAPVDGVAIGDFFRSKRSGILRRVIAQDDDRWKLEGVEVHADGPRVCFEATADLLDPSQWTRYESTVPRALPAGVAWYQHATDKWHLESTRGAIATVRRFDRRYAWTHGTGSADDTVWADAPTLDDAQAEAETACRERGVFAALPDLGTPAPPEQPRPTGDAARTLRRLLSLCAREDEHGPIASPAGETPKQRAAMRGRLVDVYLVELFEEMGTSIEAAVLERVKMELSATKPKPAAMSHDHRVQLTAYLEGNERGRWDGEEAPILCAIRLLRERREEAATSDANAAELAGKLDTAQKRIAEMGGEIDALQTALEAARGAVKAAESLRDMATRRAEKAEAELDAAHRKAAEMSKRWRRTLEAMQVVIDASDRDAGVPGKPPTEREKTLADLLWSDMRNVEKGAAS